MEIQVDEKHQHFRNRDSVTKNVIPSRRSFPVVGSSCYIFWILSIIHIARHPCYLFSIQRFCVTLIVKLKFLFSHIVLKSSSSFSDSVTALFFNYKNYEHKMSSNETFLMCRALRLVYLYESISSIQFEWVEILKVQSEKTWFRHIWTGRLVIVSVVLNSIPGNVS